MSMGTGTEKIALFDVDHTVCRGATALSFMLICMKRGYIRWWYLLSAPIIYILYRLFSVKMEFLFRIGLPKLRGITRMEFEDIAREAFERRVRSQVFEDARAEMGRLRSLGVRVLLATAAPYEAVLPLAQYCDIREDEIIATRFSYSAEVFQGKLEGVPVFAKYKLGVIGDFVARMGGTLETCSFYSDSIHDYPLLSSVGRPVAVNPDYRLWIAASCKGWEIRRFRK